MQFRPYPILTICSLAALALLIWLGVWQFNRADWKADEIDAYTARAEQDVREMEVVFCEQRPSSYGWPVQPGAPVSEDRLRVYGFSTDGEAGWRIFAPIEPPSCLASQGHILTEVAFEPFTEGPTRAIERVKVDRLEVKRPTFASDNAPEKDQWYWFDVPAMRAALFPGDDTQLNTEWVLTADDGLPEHLKRVPPERHIGYSVTWFGLAISLLVLYVAFHIRAGRLTFGSRQAD